MLFGGRKDIFLVITIRRSNFENDHEKNDRVHGQTCFVDAGRADKAVQTVQAVAHAQPGRYAVHERYVPIWAHSRVKLVIMGVSSSF